jgi:hypothetical protein
MSPHRSDQPGVPSRFVVREWEIFYSYTTHFNVAIPDSRAAAHALVRDGIAESAMVSDGACFWRDGDAIKHGSAEIETDSAFSVGRFIVPEELRDVPFALETIGQANWYRFSEMRLFGEGGLPQPYVRAFLGECLLVDEGEHAVSLYPMLKLYESGAASVSLRLIGPLGSMYEREFTEKYVHLPQRGLCRAEVPPGLAAMAPIAGSQLRFGHVLRRAQLAWMHWAHKWMVRSRTRECLSGDFQFAHVELPRSEDDSYEETTATLALTILATAGYVVGADRTGLSLVLLGSRPTPAMYGPWHGRPHIYLVRFSGQEPSASANEARHGDAFARLLGGTSAARPSRWLPANQRTGDDDYGFYVGSSNSLVAFGREHLRSVRRQGRGDANRGDLIYEEHVKLEMLELVHALSRRLAEVVRDNPTSWEVALAQRQLLDLELSMSETGRYGEVRSLLAAGWTAWGVNELRNIAARGLELLRAEATDAANLGSARVSYMLGATAVVLGFEPIGRVIVKPLWESAWPAHAKSDTWYGVVALGMLALAVWTVGWWARSPKGRRAKL